MNSCFLLFPWEQIDAENDTSLALNHECVKRGHGIAISTRSNLTIRNNETNAFCKVSNKVDKLVDLHGPVVAAMEEITYSESKVKIERGDIIFAYCKDINKSGFVGVQSVRIGPLGFDSNQVSDLVVFLETLTGEPLSTTLTTPPSLPP